jgi:hypothetical protein
MIIPGPVGRRDLLLFQQLPLNGLEEGVGGDLHEPGLLVAAQAVSRVLVEEPLEDAGRLHRQRPRDPDSFLQNHLPKKLKLFVLKNASIFFQKHHQYFLSKNLYRGRTWKR